MRDPNPRFDAAFYIDEHPEAIGNPLLFHLLEGRKHGWPTEPPLRLASLLPSTAQRPFPPAGLEVDVLIPVFRGYEQTRRCIESVLADRERPAGRVLVIDDCSPEPKISAWLAAIAKRGRIQLLRNAHNLGFVRSVNRGLNAAGKHDAVLLNSDTEVPPGWLARLAGVVYSSDDIATASPFSNNATICSYPGLPGGPTLDGGSLAQLDAACRAAHAGRMVDVPTTVGFCMYIRRAALDAVGRFDASAFGHGYGEEVDFCRRATAQGWRHVLACGVFVYHEGEVSFGAHSAHARQGQAVIDARYPEFTSDLHRHARLAPALCARFAVTAALFRDSGLPGILLVSHAEGGGVRRQLLDLVARSRGQANFLLLEPDLRGIRLSVPTLAGHPALNLAAGRVEDLALYLRSAGIARVHIHHTMEMTMDLRALIALLDVPFDFTLHDYFALCPQVNFLPFLDAQYCGEPDTRHCNACIAARPSQGAADIESWRREHAWLLHDAARVICPSKDARARLVRHGHGARVIVAEHEPITERDWPRAAQPLRGKGRNAEKLRVALLGVLADRKGLASVASVVAAAGDDIEFNLIGYPEANLEAGLASRLHVTGAYAENELPALIEAARPHVFWFPAQWPETYSYTLSAAIAAGGAIVAADIGAFPERLQGRPLSWLVPAAADSAGWLASFDAARQALAQTSTRQPTATRALVSDYYPNNYLAPLAAPRKPPARPRGAAQRVRILIIPELLESGRPGPCAFIRLLQPLHHRDVAAGCDIRIGGIDDADRAGADIVVTQRHAVADAPRAAALVARCRAQGARLIFDLDDDLLNVQDDHPEAARLQARAPAVRILLDGADDIWVSTAALRTGLAAGRRRISVIGNGLDENLWWPPPALDRPTELPARLLYMGTGTHAADLEMILAALQRLRAAFGGRVAIDVIGITPRDLPDGLNRIDPPHVATHSYPAFVNWLSTQNAWQIGLAPLLDTTFNRGKSAIKAMDYAALGMPCVASDIGVYDAAIRHGGNGLLVANTEAAWFAALAGLLRDPARRLGMARQAWQDFQDRFSLIAQAAARRRALLRK